MPKVQVLMAALVAMGRQNLALACMGYNRHTCLAPVAALKAQQGAIVECWKWPGTNSAPVRAVLLLQLQVLRSLCAPWALWAWRFSRRAFGHTLAIGLAFASWNSDVPVGLAVVLRVPHLEGIPGLT